MVPARHSLPRPAPSGQDSSLGRDGTAMRLIPPRELREWGRRLSREPAPPGRVGGRATGRVRPRVVPSGRCRLACSGSTPRRRSGSALHAVLGMLLALVAAEAAGCRAGLEGGLNHRRIEGCLTGQDLPGHNADVGAVQVQPDAAGQQLRVLLAQAGVGAGDTRLRAIEAGPDAFGENPGVGGWLGLVWISRSARLMVCASRVSGCERWRS